MLKNILYNMGIIALVFILLFGSEHIQINNNSNVVNFSAGTIYITQPLYITNSTKDPLTNVTGMYGFDANVIVTSTGSIIVKNATLYFIQDAVNSVSLTIQKGGLFKMINSTFTVSPDRIAPSINFTITSNGGNITFINSLIKYPGWFNVSNSQNITLLNTVFTSETPSQINQLLKFGYPQSAIPYVIYGPTPVFNNVTLIMKNTKFPSLFQDIKSVLTYSGTFPSSNTFPITISSSSAQVTTVSNSFIVSGIPSYLTFYNATVIVNITAGSSYSNDSILSSTFRNLYYSTPIQFSQNPQNFVLNFNFANTYYIANSTSLSSKFYVNITKPSSGSITVNYVKIMLFTYNFNFIKQNFNVFNSKLYGSNIYLSVNLNNSNGNPFKNSLYALNSTIYILNLTAVDQNSYSSPPDPPYYINSNTNIYLYRNLNVKVLNYNSEPLAGLNTNVTPNNLPILLNDVTIMNNTIVNNLNKILWNKLNISNYGLTDVNGNVNYALFSDWINLKFWPNSLWAGDYNFIVSVNGSLLKFLNVALPHFPSLNLSGTLNLKVSVIVPDILAKSIFVNEKLIHKNTYTIYVTSTVYGKSLNNVPISFYLGNYNILNTQENIIINKTNYLNVSFTVPSYIPPGNYSLKAIFNPNHSIYESNYSNNIVFENVQVYPNIDIAILNEKLTNITLYGNNFLNFTVTNLGLENATNVPINVIITGPESFYYSNTTILNYINASYSINFSMVFKPKAIGNYSIVISAPYYWDFNQTNNYVYLSQNYGIDYYFINAGYYLTSNITPGSPMSITLYSKIGVSGIIPSYAPSILVSFYDLTNNINIGNTQSIYSNGYIYANLSTNYFLYGYVYKVGLILNPYKSIPETNYSNDYYNFTIYIPPVYGSQSTVLGPYMNGTLVPIYANITLGASPINNLSIIFYFPSIKLEKTFIYNANANSKISCVYYFDTSKINMMNENEISIPYEILITYPEIYPYYFEYSSGFLNIFERPNLTLNVNLITNSYANNLTKVPMGVYFGLNISVFNNGGWPAYGNASLMIIDNGAVILNKNISNLSPGSIKTMEFNITAQSIGNHHLIIYLNYTNILQKIQGPRIYVLNYNVIPPVISIIMITPSPAPLAGQNFNLIFYVLNVNATQQQGRNVYVSNIDLNVYIGQNIYPLHIGSNGIGVISLKINSSGDYKVLVTYSIGGVSNEQVMANMLSVKQTPFTIPMFVIILVVVIVLVGGIFGYAYLKYRKVEKNLMVCGNCGSLIPADSEKCPVCGVVFEKENVKCGNCGSWIKKDAKYCPVCGAIYMNENDPEYEKIESARKEYQEEITKYKTEAKRDLGEKFTDEEFYRWWNTKPEFITFQDWMEKKEEEKRPSVVCPVCGTLNPKGNKFCKVCGAELPQDEGKK
ncbi:MAG: hypothetical protein QW167_04715 [Thermoplasmata archaeon]